MNKVYKLKRSSHGVKVVSEIAKGHSGEKTVREGFGSTIFSSIGKIASAPALGRLAMSLATIVAISAPFMPSEAEAAILCRAHNGALAPIYYIAGDSCPGDTTPVTTGISWGSSFAVADYSTAFGNNSHANGVNSLALMGAIAHKANTYAIGVGAETRGDNSIAFGNGAVAGKETSGDFGGTIALGLNAQALGGRSVAIGKNTHAHTAGAIAIGGSNGKGADANGTAAISIGSDSSSAGYGTIAIGYQAKSSTLKPDAQGNIAIGAYAEAIEASTLDPNDKPGQSTAIGMGAKATGGQAMALGANTVANGYGSISIGGDDIGGAASAPKLEKLNEYLYVIGGEEYASEHIEILKGVFAGYLTAGSGKLTLNNDKINEITDPDEREAVRTKYNKYNNTSTDGHLYIPTKASGLGSLAVGQSSVASNTFSNAFGYRDIANGIGASAIGTYNVVDGHGSTAVGAENTIVDVNSTAIGVINTISGGSTNAMATGNGNIVEGSNFSIAAGYYNENHADNTISVGLYNDANNTSAAAVGLSNYALGEGSIAVGGLNVAKGDYATAFGLKNNAMADNTLAIGTLNNAKAANSMALGADNNTTAKFSVAAGMSNVAEGEKSAALGFGNTASATRSFSVGMDNNVTATGVESIAHGYGNTVSGKNSIAMGTGNTVTGNRSGVFGDPSNIDGNDSYAIGNNNKIKDGDDKTFILGNNVQTTIENSVFLGDGAAYVTGDTSASMDTYSTNSVAIGKIAANKLSFAGAIPTGVVSIGNATAPRRIQNVAAGLISADSTDAINGSQLYSVIENLPSGGSITSDNRVVRIDDDKIVSPYIHINGVGPATNVTFAQATGTNAVAIGANSQANGDNSVALMGTTADGKNAMTWGENVSAGVTTTTTEVPIIETYNLYYRDKDAYDASDTTMVGYFKLGRTNSCNTATFNFVDITTGKPTGVSVCVGANFPTLASGRVYQNDASVVMGTTTETTTQITGKNATAFGYNTQAQADESTAWGRNTIAGAKNSTAFGSGSKTVGDDSEQVIGEIKSYQGREVTSFSLVTYNGQTYYRLYFPDGHTEDKTQTQIDNSAVVEYYPKGMNSVAFGNYTTASNTNAIAFGEKTTASGQNSTAFGVGSEANATNATAFGDQAKAGGENSTAFGFKAVAEGKNSTAFGHDTKAIGDRATAFGISTHANGRNSTAFGYDTYANGENATAWGSQTHANGGGSTAFGFDTQADGENSVAWGSSSKVLQQLNGDTVEVLLSTDNQPVGAVGSYYVIDEHGNILVQDLADRNAANNWIKDQNGGLLPAQNSTAFGDSSLVYATNALGALGGQVQIQGVNSAAIGKGATVSVADTIALGSGSVANRDNLGENNATWLAKTYKGYDVQTKTAGDKNLKMPDDAVWIGTANAIAVGNIDKNVTRQITGLAAGSEDTDAVNVAQLKRAVSGAGTIWSVGIDKNGTGTNKDGTLTFGKHTVGTEDYNKTGLDFIAGDNVDISYVELSKDNNETSSAYGIKFSAKDTNVTSKNGSVIIASEYNADTMTTGYDLKVPVKLGGDNNGTITLVSYDENGDENSSRP
ncbi:MULTISPECIES: hypothetical protein, partial [unclassified Campylobacter]